MQLLSPQKDPSLNVLPASLDVVMIIKQQQLDQTVKDAHATPLNLVVVLMAFHQVQYFKYFFLNICYSLTNTRKEHFKFLLRTGTCTTLKLSNTNCFSLAVGMHMEGCVMSCNTSAFGCCPDGSTPAHGHGGEGCCLLYSYGCCPDNYKPAEGPHLEGTYIILYT